MADTYDLAVYKKERNRMRARGQARCLTCGHEWEAIVNDPVDDKGEFDPYAVVAFECPCCHINSGVFKHPFLYPDAGESTFWECRCGCNMFIITPSGTHCPVCGLKQDFNKSWQW